MSSSILGMRPTVVEMLSRISPVGSTRVRTAMSASLLRGRFWGDRVFSEWHNRAACKGGTDLFFSYDEEKVARARAICEGCPVRQECLLTALADRKLYGVWGGTTEAERRRFHRRRVA